MYNTVSLTIVTMLWIICLKIVMIVDLKNPDQKKEEIKTKTKNYLQKKKNINISKLYIWYGVNVQNIKRIPITQQQNI